MISSVVVHITSCTMRFKTSVLKSLDAFLQPRPVLFLILVVGATLQESSGNSRTIICVGFLDDAKLALHDCRESKKEVVTESVGNQRLLLWALSGVLVGLGCTDNLDCVSTVFDGNQSKIWICAC